MNFLGNLYTIAEEKPSGTEYVFVVRFYPEHFIYAAHFPGEPITPGVCIIQMAVELLSRRMNSTLEVAEFKNVKFLKVLVPEKNQDIPVTIGRIDADGEQVRCAIVVGEGENIYAKINVICRIVR